MFPLFLSVSGTEGEVASQSFRLASEYRDGFIVRRLRTAFSGLPYFLMMEVIGFLTPLYPVKKALAEPKFRYMSRRTGR